MQSGDVVVIRAFDEVPEHWFLIDEVLEDCVTGEAVLPWRPFANLNW